MKLPLIFPFLLAVVSLYYYPILSPITFQMPFALFLAMLFCRKSLVTSLWIATLTGFFLDCFYATPFGIMPIIFFLTTFCLHPLKRFIFEENLPALFLYTLLTSYAVAVFSYAFLLKINFLTPLVNAIIAFLWYFLPLGFIKLFSKLKVRKT